MIKGVLTFLKDISYVLCVLGEEFKRRVGAVKIVYKFFTFSAYCTCEFTVRVSI